VSAKPVTLAFYEGRIARGEYNKKRREIALQLQEQGHQGTPIAIRLLRQGVAAGP
jgi:hypothetical protein